MKKDLDFLKGIYIAHRGIHNNDGGIVENSVAAFKKAIDSGLAIELDLCMLKDGKIIVHHDDDFGRLLGLDKNVVDCTYDEIKDLKLLDSNECVPLFEDVLKFVDGKVLLDIEIKTGTPPEDICPKICELLDNYKGPFIVKSFSPLIVLWFKKNRPGYIRGQLAYNFKDNKTLKPMVKFALKNMLFNILTKPDFIAYDLQSLPNKKVARLGKNHPVLVWTITSDDELSDAKKYGDSFIFEGFEV